MIAKREKIYQSYNYSVSKYKDCFIVSINFSQGSLWLQMGNLKEVARYISEVFSYDEVEFYQKMYRAILKNEEEREEQKDKIKKLVRRLTAFKEMSNED